MTSVRICLCVVCVLCVLCLVCVALCAWALALVRSCMEACMSTHICDPDTKCVLLNLVLVETFSYVTVKLFYKRINANDF